LQFDIEINTINAIREHGALISVTASERIAEELRHIFSSGSSLKTIREMQNDGFLMQLFPELGHFTDEGQHRILQIYNHIELMLGDIPLYFHNEADKISIYFREGSRIACLKLTALFPDMQLSAQVSKRLRLSCKETELMQTIIVNQHKMARLHEMDKREIAHMLLELRDDVYPCLVFLISQHLICQLTEHYLLAACQRMIAFYHSEFITRVSMPPLVNGDDLIETFHLAPSPLFREILYEITLLTLEGAITTRQEAIREIKERWKL
jgi:tRNA nucleotidyltransferase/poly(A) polymerase